MRIIVDRSFPGQSAERLDAHVAQMVAKRIVVAVHPSKTMSWDHGKLPTFK